MRLRGGGCFTFPAMLGVVGCLLIFGGSMAEADRPVKFGVLCLVGAAALLGAVLYGRWQGWVE
jgi:hypothetical protein